MTTNTNTSPNPINGTAKPDEMLQGTAGIDIINGMGGDGDRLFGKAGNDIYVLESGSGHDIIDESRGNSGDGDSADTIELRGAGVTLSSVAFKRVGNDLEVGLKNSDGVVTDSVTVKNHYGSAVARVEKLSINGVTWDIATLAPVVARRERYVISTSGNDVFDLVNGVNDHVIGLGGNDEYIFGAGAGHDRIYKHAEYSSPNSVDKIRIRGVAASRVQLTRHKNGRDLIVQFRDSQGNVTNVNDSLTVLGQYGASVFNSVPVESIVFDDGTTWGWADTLEKVALRGGAGHDRIVGGMTASSRVFNDTFDSNGGGNDHLYGYGGNDVYLLGGDTDHDIIHEGSGYRFVENNRFYIGGNDTIRIKSGYDRSNVTVSRMGDDLVVELAKNGDSDSLIVRNHFTDANARVEHIVFEDSGNNHAAYGASYFNTLREGASLTAEERGSLAFNTFNGTSGNDRIDGTAGAAAVTDVMNGKAGVDILRGFSGNDHLCGDEGNDTLYGGAGNDILKGGTGNDTLYGGAGNDSYLFAAGDGYDIINEGVDNSGAANSGNDKIVIAADSSSVRFERVAGHTNAANWNDLLIHLTNANGAITDTLRVANHYAGGKSQVECVTFVDSAGVESDPVGHGDDKIKKARIVGTGGNDSIGGTSGVDFYDTVGGNDRLHGFNGDDVYYLGEGTGHDIAFDYYFNPNLPLGDLCDEIRVKEGIDVSSVRLVKDTKTHDGLIVQLVDDNGVATDSMEAAYHFRWRGSQVELVTFESDAGTVWRSAEFALARAIRDGGSGRDVLVGDHGHDVIHGGGGVDYVLGSAGNDWLYGDEGNDHLYGGVGNDHLYGGDGFDALHGNEGNDHLHGGDGDNAYDTLQGGGGNDTYYFGFGYGSDIVSDSGGEKDVIRITSEIAPSSIQLRQGSGGILIVELLDRSGGVADSLAVAGQFGANNASSIVEEIRAGDKVLKHANYLSLISEIAAFNGGTSTHATMSAVLGAHWEDNTALTTPA